MDAINLMGMAIKSAAELTADRDGLAAAKLVVFANIPQDVPFMAGAYLGVGEPESVVNVGVSGPGVVKNAILRAIDDNQSIDLSRVSEIIKQTAARLTRAGELVGRDVAEILQLPFGIVDKQWVCQPSAHPEVPPFWPC
jgi:uncharacterized protein (UPF0210 family)